MLETFGNIARQWSTIAVIENGPLEWMETMQLLSLPSFQRLWMLAASCVDSAVVLADNAPGVVQVRSKNKAQLLYILY